MKKGLKYSTFIQVYNDNGYDYHHDSRPYGLEKLFRQYLLIFISSTKRGEYIFMSLFCSLARLYKLVVSSIFSTFINLRVFQKLINILLTWSFFKLKMLIRKV